MKGLDLQVRIFDRKIVTGQEEKGFTLLEVMVALVILVTGLMSVLSLVTSVIRGNAFSDKMITATILAQDKMEELMTLSFNASALDPDQHTDPGNPINGLFDRRWVVNDFGGCKRIDIAVGWQGIEGRPHAVTLTTMLSVGDEL